MALTSELPAEDQRVLGCLIEKAATTPENYPLTMNALVAACNQTSNRDPVVSYREDTVNAALTALRERKLIRIVYPAHARVTKYRHVLDEVWALSPQELAVLAVLLLRGGQTQNELAARTERYGNQSDLDDLGGIPGILDRLARRPEPLVRLIERRPGQREDRYIHLLGPTDIADEPAASITRSPSGNERILALEAETANLRRELDVLRKWVEDVLGGPSPPPE
ncbi:MAG: YceH family protein [Actinomycetota bacterium]|nr:YceH family protein [Actinomycetota bacterium]